MNNELQPTEQLPELDRQKQPGAIYYDLNHGRILRIKRATEKGFYFESGYYSKEWHDHGEIQLSKRLAYIGSSREEVERYLARAKELVETGEGIELIKAIQEDQEEPTMELMRQEDKLFALQRKALHMLEKSEQVKQQMKVAMEVKKAEMEIMMREAEALISEAMESVAKIQKVVRSLELYCGVDEEMVQIQEGNPASPETPLSLRQAVIFMDEEVGQWRQGGFDYSNVKDFDKWLTVPANLFRVAPEEKCIVAFRPRRYVKDYKDPYENSVKNRWNKETYFLIRNGGNLYRIFTENLQLGKKMFMSTEDLEKLSKNEDVKTSWGGTQKRYTEQEIADKKDLFTRQALFIQGILDRGEVLSPVPPGVNIFNPETYQNWLKLIYDADGVLTDGRPSFKDWKDQINEQISEGSRVVIAEDWLRSESRDSLWILNNRCKRYYSNSYNAPGVPWDGGMYIAEKGFEKRSAYSSGEWDFAIKYFPGGTYSSWSDYGIERKNKILFGVDRTDNVLNYDLVSLEDVEYYLNDRVNREGYANMLPLLEKIRVERLAEIEQEKDFVKLIAGRNSIRESVIWSLVDWWKTKNKWKRPIRKDDTLALRMIEKRLKKFLTSDAE